MIREIFLVLLLSLSSVTGEAAAIAGGAEKSVRRVARAEAQSRRNVEIEGKRKKPCREDDSFGPVSIATTETTKFKFISKTLTVHRIISRIRYLI
jgi:hypothetical protein